MHELHDDALERELARLSEYSGPSDAPPVWEDALEAHRRERDRRLWVWVRRPAPVLAAACLALLVASVALRPPVAERAVEEQVLAARSQAVALGKSDRADALSAVGPGGTAIGGGGGGGSGLGSWNDHGSRDLTQDTRGIDHLTVSTTPNDLKSLGWMGNSPPSSVRGGAPVDFDNDLAGNRGAFSKTGADTYADAAPAEPPPPSTTVTLGVADVNHFYYRALPKMVNEKLGDQLTDGQMLKAQAKDASEGVQFVLRVNEHRVGEVLEELRRAGQVDVELVESMSKETRLSQIDARLENDKRSAARFAEAEKNKVATAPPPTNAPTAPAAPPTPSAPSGTAGAGADLSAGGGRKVAPATPEATQLNELTAARSKVEGDIEKLSMRRRRIANEGETATINVVAVPEDVWAKKKAAAAKAAEGRNELADKASAVDPTVKEATGTKTPELAAAPPRDVEKAHDAKLFDSKSDSPAKPDSLPTPLTTAAATPPALLTPAGPSRSAAPAGGDRSSTGQPDVGEVPTVSGGLAQRKEEAFKGSNRQLTPAASAPPASVAPPSPPAIVLADAPTAAPAQQPTDRAPASNRSTENDRAQRAEGGKLKQAAREGWSNLGDSAAGFVRTAIGTMLYLGPALVLVIGVVWWRRRQKSLAMREPAPADSASSHDSPLPPSLSE